LLSNQAVHCKNTSGGYRNGFCLIETVGLLDLFAEYKLLDMGERLGRFISQYRVEYFVPDQVNGPIVYSYRLRPGADKRIYDRISDITISMKGTDHL